jgi:carbon monoxide dehydrogenase subunit G
MELQQTIEIARPPADVYAFVATDHEKNHPRWDPAISDMRQQTPGPVAVGTEFTLDRKMMGRKTPMTIRITKMDPPRELDFQVNGPMPMQMVMRMEPSGEGATALTMHFNAQPSGLWRVMEPMMRMQMGKEMGRVQLRIKEMVESK